MKNIKSLFLCSSIILSYTSTKAQEVSTFPDLLNEKSSNSIGFVSNHGQILDIDNQTRSDIYFQSVHSAPSSFYLQDKISFVYASKLGQTESEDTIRRLDMTWKYSDVGYSVIPYGVE